MVKMKELKYIEMWWRTMKKQQKYLELWGDLVNLKDLVQAILLSSLLTMGGYFLAPSGDTTKQLFFGLAGAISALLINTYLVKPKRIIKKSGNDN